AEHHRPVRGDGEPAENVAAAVEGAVGEAPQPPGTARLRGALSPQVDGDEVREVGIVHAYAGEPRDPPQRIQLGHSGKVSVEPGPVLETGHLLGGNRQAGPLRLVDGAI